MTDIAKLETETLGAIAAADTLEALDSVRVGALGKQGNISLLMKTMGNYQMTIIDLPMNILYGVCLFGFVCMTWRATWLATCGTVAKNMACTA